MKRLLLILHILPFFLSGCDKFLDVVPEEDMTTLNSIFETRDQAQDWLWSCYTFLQDPTASLEYNEAFLGADEIVCGDYQRNRGWNGLRISSGLQNSLDPYGDLWSKRKSFTDGRTDLYTAINLCNVFIDKIDQVYNMEDYEKKEWKAEVKALKAYFYFELVRRYGPIILVPYNLDPNISIREMQIPRSHVDTCFSTIVQLCDEAAEDLSPFNLKESSRRGYFSKESALALKARVLLYQASDLFNGNPDYVDFKNRKGEQLFSTVKDKEKWRRAAEAAEEAIAVCLDNGRGLINDQVGATKLQSYMLNIEGTLRTFGFSNNEALLMVKGHGASGKDDFYFYTIPDITSDPYHYNAGTSMSPSLKMVEMFYTSNGLPIEQDPTYGGGNIYGMTQEVDPYYTDVVVMREDIPRLHTRREPRFYASIAADRCYWRLGKNVNNNYKVEVFQGETFGLKEKKINSLLPQNLSGYFLEKWTYSTLELFTYTNNMSAMGDSPYPVIRMAELYLIAAEAWNEYLDRPDNRVYDNLNVIRERAGIPTVQESWAMARDKNKVNNQVGMREIIRQEWNIEFAFEGMRYWNLRRWKTAHLELNEKLYGWNILGDTREKFYNNGIPVIVNSNNKFVAPRDYFYPIRSEEILISACVQNIGW